MKTLLNGLRAAGEPTRLRLLALCAHGELSVSELTQILGQSQPRVSRHLKLLVEAGLLQRYREGTQVFFRITDYAEAGLLARTLVDMLPQDDTEMNRDLSRLEQIRQKRLIQAESYFRENAARWNEIRSLHVPESDVEQAVLDIAGERRFDCHVDIGTGTGRILSLLAPQVERGIGIDMSPEMLAIARTQIEQARLRNLQVRKGDMYAMPLDDNSTDLTTLHLVLHYSLDPALVIGEAARILKPGGLLIVVDFAPHHEDYLRDEHNHQRLGFDEREVNDLISSAGLLNGPTSVLSGDPLTVNIWQAEKPVGGSTGSSVITKSLTRH